ncbi:hypothetical protein ACTXT7_014893 [Hymenolepis weldensis]
MFIDLGSEAPHISDDEIGEAAGTLFSRENLFDIQDSDGENVEFIISSGDSSDEENPQQQLNEPHSSNSRNLIAVNGYQSRAIHRVNRDYRLNTLYENVTLSSKMKSDTDQDKNSQPSCSTKSSAPIPRRRKYSSAKHPGVILQYTTTRRLPPCRCKAFFENPKWRYFFTLLAYIAFICLGSPHAAIKSCSKPEPKHLSREGTDTSTIHLPILEICVDNESSRADQNRNGNIHLSKIEGIRFNHMSDLAYLDRGDMINWIEILTFNLGLK